MRNIMFCGNSKVFDGVLSCMLSIFKRTETKEPFSITVLTMDVSHLNPNYTCIDDDMISFLDKVAKTYNPENLVKKIDVTSENQRFKLSGSFKVRFQGSGWGICRAEMGD